MACGVCKHVSIMSCHNMYGEQLISIQMQGLLHACTTRSLGVSKLLRHRFEVQLSPLKHVYCRSCCIFRC